MLSVFQRLILVSRAVFKIALYLMNFGTKKNMSCFNYQQSPYVFFDYRIGV